MAVSPKDHLADGSEILPCTPMRPAASNTPARFKLPPKSCDCHFHVFEPGYSHVDKLLYTFPDGTLTRTCPERRIALRRRWTV